MLAASDMQPSAERFLCSDYLTCVSDQHRQNPSVGFVFEDLALVAPAPTAGSPDERPKRKRASERLKAKPEVVSAESAFSSLSKSGISLGIEELDSRCVYADGLVVVCRAALSHVEAADLGYDAKLPVYAKLGNQESGLRLLSEKSEMGSILKCLWEVLGMFSKEWWPYRCQIRFYTFLATLPGCPAQDSHLDHTDIRVWSLILCIGFCMREVRFIVDGKEFAVILHPGDAVLFRGNICHFGGPSGTNCSCPADAPCCAAAGQVLSVCKYCVELALHCYVVVDIFGRPPFDWAKLGAAVYGCPHG